MPSSSDIVRPKAARATARTDAKRLAGALVVNQTALI